jgi:hypothetical protein
MASDMSPEATRRDVAAAPDSRLPDSAVDADVDDETDRSVAGAVVVVVEPDGGGFPWRPRGPPEEAPTEALRRPSAPTNNPREAVCFAFGDGPLCGAFLTEPAGGVASRPPLLLGGGVGLRDDDGVDAG